MFEIATRELFPMSYGGIFIEPGQGRSVLHAVFKFSSEDTRGLLTILEVVLEPGRMVPPHQHVEEDEYLFVIEGEIGARVGDEELIAPSGSYLSLPRGIPDVFWNPTDAPIRVQVSVTPAALERYFDELAVIIRESSPEEIESARTELSEKYGQPLVKDWIPELKARHGLRLPEE